MRAVLEASISDTALSRGVDITVDGGKVTLSGVVMQSGDLSSAVDAIGQIEGVLGVDNNIHRVVN